MIYAVIPRPHIIWDMNLKKLAAAGKILRRCTICKKYHAAYLVEIPEFGKCYLCYAWWTARVVEQERKKPEAATSP